MSRRAAWRRLAACALAALAAIAPRAARAQAPANGDSLMRAYVRSMRDSSDAYFGLSAAPTDTAGLDSALARGLAMLPGARARATTRRRGLLGRADWAPALGFNRADGGELGATATIGSARRWGTLAGTLQYATGTRDALGNGTWQRVWRARPGRRAASAWLEARAGRSTDLLNRDRRDRWLNTLRAFVGGDDWEHYLRRDGFASSLQLALGRADAGVGWRNELESSLDATTSWTLLGRDPVIPINTHATVGRASELRFSAGAGMPFAPWRIEATHWTSDPRMGSAFRYRRTRFAFGGDQTLGSHLALTAQGVYGRLRGDALPQDVFYMGGTSTLETLDANEAQGTGIADARAELLLLDDVLALARVPHPAMFPVQLAAFGAIGAAWGRDPSTGIARATARDWPERTDWLPEVGVGALWRPGLPTPDTFLRVDWAVPIGPDGRTSRLALSFQHALEFLNGR